MLSYSSLKCKAVMPEIANAQKKKIAPRPEAPTSWLKSRNPIVGMQPTGIEDSVDDAHT